MLLDVWRPSGGVTKFPFYIIYIIGENLNSESSESVPVPNVLNVSETYTSTLLLRSHSRTGCRRYKADPVGIVESVALRIAPCTHSYR